MAAPPYMKFYVADYLADTLTLSRSQHGSYILLLMAMWRAGGKLPAVDVKLAAIAKCSAREWAADRETLLGFFQRKGGQITHKRLTAEMAKAEYVSGVRKQASDKGVREKRKKNSGAAEPNGSPNGDQKAAYIRHQSQREKPPKPPEGAFSPEVFEQAIAAFPRAGMTTTSPEACAEPWATAAHEVGEKRLLDAVIGYASFQRGEGTRAKQVPAFHRWLSGRRYEIFLPRPATTAPPWQGPPEVWAAVVADREPGGEAFALSWLAGCVWQDVPSKALICGPTAFGRLREEVGPLLRDMGIELQERAA